MLTLLSGSSPDFFSWESASLVTEDGNFFFIASKNELTASGASRRKGDAMMKEEELVGV